MMDDDDNALALIVGLIIALLFAIVLLLYALRDGGGIPKYYRFQIEMEVGKYGG